MLAHNTQKNYYLQMHVSNKINQYNMFAVIQMLLTSGFARFEAPNVRNTDKIFLKPKS